MDSLKIAAFSKHLVVLAFIMCFISIAQAQTETQATEHQINIPYFTETAEFSSVLTLNNNWSGDVLVTVTVFKRQGEPFELPPIQMPPLAIKRFSLRQLTSQTTGDFSQGNLKLRFHAISPTMITSQVSIVCWSVRPSGSRRT